MADTIPTPVRIAIIGGGLAGATLGNALIQLPHLDVQIYESAPEFSENGAAVALTVNAQRVLKELSGKHILERAGAVPVHSSRIMLVSSRFIGLFYTPFN
jgi:salicylate hydroxylase